MFNNRGLASGNDGAFDNIQIVDVSPSLDKSFSPAVANPGDVVTLTFTVTNTTELAAKPGWSFTDNLPAGMAVAPSPNTASTCDNSVVGATAGGTSVAFSGDLQINEVSCTLSVDVTAGLGTYVNGADNISSPIGVIAPPDATLQIVPAVGVSYLQPGVLAALGIAGGGVILVRVRRRRAAA
jgi:uncharacterized repeat protein (TIGR01451 family)